jgi:hypothetical protein
VRLNDPVADSDTWFDQLELVCQLKFPVKVSDRLVLFVVVVVKLRVVDGPEDEVVLGGPVLVEEPERP